MCEHYTDPLLYAGSFEIRSFPPIRFFKHRHTTLNSDVMRISASPLHLKTVTSQERKKNIWVPNVDSSELVCIYPDKKKCISSEKINETNIIDYICADRTQYALKSLRCGFTGLIWYKSTT